MSFDFRGAVQKLFLKMHARFLCGRREARYIKILEKTRTR
ncbi:hypothetical protein HMPREF7215_0581 [Pyramidobacter piscolens W5455]|uniref:Uncharacterized protein n=1 Tax=Pyramidobacter piscolens W5455 TaxID=352165 RepID=A0ABM9ZUZ8_9BACT|nr:hypothetical protein HMPREF7215_0581 [Pyramidobacter piscolens W5455]